MQPGIWVKRTYGRVTLRDQSGAEVQRSTYHEYSLHKSNPADPHGKAAGPAKPSCRLYHVKSGAKTGMESQMGKDLYHQGMLRLRQQSDGSSRYVQFEDSQGNVTGALEANEQGRGVVLRSRAGDMAEWHPRLPHEPPFEEGDVVACVFAVQLAAAHRHCQLIVGIKLFPCRLVPPPEDAKHSGAHLTRTTRGARQFGASSSTSS